MRNSCAVPSPRVGPWELSYCHPCRQVSATARRAPAERVRLLQALYDVGWVALRICSESQDSP
eukprot:12459896-Alexandrium_andersonii.AAC.1